MADVKLKADTSVQTLIDDNLALVTTDWAAGDYDNGTALDLWANIYLTLQYDTTAPAANLPVANLYLIPGDGAGTEVYPTGGDAGLGTDFIPQGVFYVGSFECINPSITTDEVLCLPRIPLYPDGNRFVIENISGYSFDSTWILKMKPVKMQVT